MTNHSNCYHPATKAGRAACRKGKAPSALDLMVAIRDTAPCADCLSDAEVSAEENLLDEGTDLDRDSWDFRLLVLRTAREYLYDRAALSACSAHEGLL